MGGAAGPGFDTAGVLVIADASPFTGPEVGYDVDGLPVGPVSV
jgi:hypothetical protein